MASVEQIRDALRNIIDPELGLDLVNLGLICEITDENGEVHVEFTLTSPACGLAPTFADQIDEIVSELDGVSKVFPRLTLTPPWTPERMSEDARFALGL